MLATELKNNSCRLARWTAQSLLAGADLMKLGRYDDDDDDVYVHVYMGGWIYE